MSANVVPKLISNPLEEVIQVHTYDVIDTDFTGINNDPLHTYSTSKMYDENPPDIVYGSKEEFDTLFYDIDSYSDDNDDDITYVTVDGNEFDNAKSKSQFQTLTSIRQSQTLIFQNVYAQS